MGYSVLYSKNHGTSGRYNTRVGAGDYRILADLFNWAFGVGTCLASNGSQQLTGDRRYSTLRDYSRGHYLFLVGFVAVGTSVATPLG